MTSIDQDIFNSLKERMKQKFPILLSTYLQDAEKYIEEIHAHVSADINPLIHAAHSLKSASGILGLTQMQKLSEQIEHEGNAIQDGSDTEERRAKIKALSDELQSAFAEIESILQQEAA